MRPLFFESPAGFRRWLEKNHRTAPAVVVGFHKKHTGRSSLTWSESVDEALCFGWIDGIRRSLDGEAYTIRFTPRRRGSVWSAINVRKVADLIRAGRMMPAGLEVYQARDPKKTNLYSFEQRENARLTPTMEQRFRANRKAWAFWEAQPPGYRKLGAFYVITAKQEATRLRRLDRLIRDSAAGRRIGMLERKKPSGSSGAPRKSGRAGSRAGGRTRH